MHPPARVHLPLVQAGLVPGSRHPQEGHRPYRVQVGDVLIAEFTAPPWTPLFATVSALVTDAGGILSHCAVVAREYGIPAVVGTGDATTRLSPGQLVTVDGAAGTVTPHEPSVDHVSASDAKA